MYQPSIKSLKKKSQNLGSILLLVVFRRRKELDRDVQEFGECSFVNYSDMKIAGVIILQTQIMYFLVEVPPNYCRFALFN